MKTLLKISLLALSLTFLSAGSSTVYICKGEQSKKYHRYENCKGLNRCSTDIYSVSLSDATGKYSRTACKICY